VIRVKITSIVCAVAFAVSFALARVHPFGNAGLYASAAESSIMPHSTVPPDVRAILSAKCADCHSMQTRSPFYGRFAPVSWLVERDIIRGREAMNLSLWDRYSADQQQTLASKIVQETKAHEMPLQQYRMIHWKSRITEVEIRTLANWAHATSSSADGQLDEPIGEGDSSRGRALFEKRCTGCHALVQNREGPKLQGVYGRTSGSIADFAYSAALKKVHIVWDENSLEKWLTDPDAFIPGNEMDFLVSKPQERRDLISYLRQSSQK